MSYGYVWVPSKRQYGERGEGGSNVVRALKLGSKWSLVGGGKKLYTHTHTHTERVVKNFCLFVCQLVGCGIEEK
jgi:hypothetical protein